MQCGNRLLIKHNLLNWFNNIKQHASSITGLVTTPGFLLFSPNKIPGFLKVFGVKFPVFSRFLRLNSRYFVAINSRALNGPVKTISWLMWLPQNNTFICQCNLFAYRKYMSTHSPVCCQSPRMILMRNINGRCPENMLVLVPIAYSDLVAAILFNFCGRWLDHPFSICCAVANYSD